MHIQVRWARSAVLVFVACAALALALLPTAAAQAAPDVGASTAAQQPATPADAHYVPADCGTPQEPGFARCFALIRTDLQHQVVADAAAPPATALGPEDIQDAYNLPDRGDGQTVAIVDAYGYAQAEDDLAVFRDYYGLPPCTTDNGCFTKVNQDGDEGPYPPDNAGWALETALDLDAVSAACPKCHILLVEGNTPSAADLGMAVDTAVELGAKYVSNSYGIPGEFLGETSYDHFYDHPGVAVTASSGDIGNVTNWPAANPNVVAIAGTKLTQDDSERGWHETAWTAAGSGCSPYEAKPDYQVNVDTNCDNRAIGDISAVADPNTGLGIYDTLGRDGWLQVGGTSLSSPLVAAMYALAGTPATGTYPVTYPYEDPGDLFDVTEGSNGNCGNVLCTAGPGWDGPTGLGTPNGVDSLSTGPHGDVAGTVTDGSTGDPITGATVTTDQGQEATTDSTGAYHLYLPVGSYDVTAQAFGYAAKTQTGVQVEQDQAVDVDFVLSAVPNASVHGTVTDGSGQGWPVYAKITVDGAPGAVWTDPFTGRYSIDLPENASYTMHVDAQLPGYPTEDMQVDLGDGGQRQDVALTVDQGACTAPGYHYRYDGPAERFTGWTGTDAQDGWTVVDNNGTGLTWGFDNVRDRPAAAGSDGDMAIMDAGRYGTSSTQDTSLVSPVMDLSGLVTPHVSFDSYYEGESNSRASADVDLSLDGGATWSNVWHQDADVVVGHVDIPIPQAAGQPNAQIRFHYHSWLHFWDIDNVVLGAPPACVPSSGGLVTGLVRDDNTGAGVVDARVSSDDAPGESALSRATPDDPSLGDGYYWMFSSLAGAHGFTASRGHYATGTATVEVAAGSVARQDFTLRAGHLSVLPGSVEKTERMGNLAKSQTVRLRNDGTQPVHVQLSEQRGGFTPMAGFRTPGTGAPLRLVKGDFSPRAVMTRMTHPGAVPHPRVAPDTTPAAGPWTDIADLPQPVADNMVAHHDGKVYSVGGENGTDYQPTRRGYVYDPVEQAWSRIADLPEPRRMAASAFVNDTMYVIGGLTSHSTAISSDVFAYDPRSNTWTERASMPEPRVNAGVAVLGGQIYVIGGCVYRSIISGCVAKSSDFRYDPNADSWTQVADLPTAIAYPACGGVPEGIVCAGGYDDTFEVVATTYRYDPLRDRWTRVADMPYVNWAMASSAANGKLQVMSGFTKQGAGYVLTNQAVEYDPATGTWLALPNVNHAESHGEAVCGIYKVGGWGTDPDPGSFAEVLPGYDQCNDGGPDVSWLSANKTELDVAPGQVVKVRVRLDNASLSQPGDYTSALRITADTPYRMQPIDVSLHLRPPKSWGKLRGTVTDADTHDAIAGAMVQINTFGGSGQVQYTLKTDEHGDYQLWLDTRYNPLQVLVAKDGYEPQAKRLRLHRGETTTLDVALTKWSPP